MSVQVRLCVIGSDISTLAFVLTDDHDQLDAVILVKVVPSVEHRRRLCTSASPPGRLDHDDPSRGAAPIVKVKEAAILNGPAHVGGLGSSCCASSLW